MVDLVNHPPHYTGHPSGVECITITEHMGFNLGNTVKYVWRADLKGDAIEDLKKARWYLDREIAKREREQRLWNSQCGEANGGQKE
jgi:heme exporter protein D